MGNLLSCRAPSGTTVFLPDGEARPVKNPAMVTAADLMLEHPRHFVAELTGRKPVPLPADHSLEAKKVYAVLSMAAGKVPDISQSLPSGSSEGMEPLSRFLLQRQHSVKAWKPSLGTIEERSVEKKMPHWLF